MARKKRPIPRFLHGPIYAAVRSAITVLGAAPPLEALRLARRAGRLFAMAPFNRARLGRAIDNIGVARPKWDQDQRREYAIRAYEHVFMLGVEMTIAQRMLTRDGWPQRVDVDTMGPPLGRLLKGGGFVAITGHCGNWELLGYMLAQLGFPLTALYRPLDFEALDQWVRRTREAHGLALLDKFGAMGDLPAVLRSGRYPSFVADQNAGDRGLHVPFFGRLASTYKSIGLLAIRNRAAVFCGMARRVGVPYESWDEDGRPLPATPDRAADSTALAPQALRYRVDVPDIIEPEDWANQPDPLFYITARYRRAIEKMVALAPEQFFWMHRYWKSRPRHERQGREFPAALRAKLEALPWMTQEELGRIMEHSRRDTAMLAQQGGPESASGPATGLWLQPATAG